MGIEAAILGAGAMGAGASLFGANAAKKAASTQANAANQANDLQYRMFQEQNALQEPFRQTGLTAQNRLLELLGIGGNQAAAGYGTYANPPTLEQLQMDPGYGFRFNEGMKALNAQAAARGGLISGGALKAATRYGQDAGSQEYQAAFNRYQANKASQLNPLQSLAGQGQTAANIMTGTAGQYGQNYANNVNNAGSARASGYIGQANALTGGIGQFLNYQSNNQLANALLNRNAGQWSMPTTNPAYAGMTEPFPGQ